MRLIESATFDTSRLVLPFCVVRTDDVSDPEVFRFLGLLGVSRERLSDMGVGGVMTSVSRIRHQLVNHLDLWDIMESIPHLVCVASPDGTTEYLNSQALAYVGAAADPGRRWAWMDVVHPDDAERALGSFAQALAAETAYEVDCRIRRHDGVYRWHTLRALPRRNLDGIIVRWIGTATDITDRHEAQAARSKLTLGTIAAIAATIEARDPYTAGHQRRVAAIADAIANELGLDDNQREGIRLAAAIHDIGKIGVPAEILTRPGELRPEEHALLRIHPLTGYEIIAGIEFPWPIADMVLQHHERLDGSGYPNGLHNDEIILGARILAVADTVEAMTNHRPYRAALGFDAALAEMQSGRGIRYDADVVDACLGLADHGRLPLEHPQHPEV